MQEISVKCDTCDKELCEETQYPHAYSLQLNCIDRKVHSNEGMVYAVMMYPPIEKPLDFCGFKCLKEWIEKEVIK